MNESFAVKGKKIIITRMIGIIGLVLLVVLGAFMGQWVEALFEQKAVTTAYISGKLEDMGELTTQKLKYSGVYEISEGKIPFITKKGFLMSYNAEIRASIDFEDVEIEITKNKVSIKLPHAEIQTPEIDEESISFLDEKRAIFNWTDKTDISGAISEAEKNDLEKMDYSQLLEQADEYTKIILEKVFEESLGKRELEISFKK